MRPPHALDITRLARTRTSLPSQSVVICVHSWRRPLAINEPGTRGRLVPCVDKRPRRLDDDGDDAKVVHGSSGDSFALYFYRDSRTRFVSAFVCRAICIDERWHFCSRLAWLLRFLFGRQCVKQEGRPLGYRTGWLCKT